MNGKGESQSRKGDLFKCMDLGDLLCQAAVS